MCHLNIPVLREASGLILRHVKMKQDLLGPLLYRLEEYRITEFECFVFYGMERLNYVMVNTPLYQH